MTVLDPHGKVALMLCESLLHALVEEAVLPRKKALQAIAVVAELVQDPAEIRAAERQESSPALIARIAETFAVKD